MSAHKLTCQCPFCKAKRGEKRVHKTDCKCAACLMKKGLRSGKNHPTYIDGRRSDPLYHKKRSIKERIRRLGREIPSKCEGCKREMLKNGRTMNSPAIDHDHKTGLIRGCLCNRCNRVLGFVKDDQKVLINLAKYLSNKKHVENI